MKAIYEAARALLLTPKSPSYNPAAARAFAALPSEMRDALRVFERVNRGHRHQLAAEVLSPGDILSRPLPGSAEYTRRLAVSDSSSALLDAVLKLTEVPDDPALAALFDATDELGWLASHAEVRVFSHLQRSKGLPPRFTLEDWTATHGGVKRQITLAVRHRRIGLTLARTVSVPAGSYNSLRESHAAIQRMDIALYALLGSVANWPQFVEAERVREVPAQPLLDRARAQLLGALNPFTPEERRQLIHHWAALCPTSERT